MEGLFDDLKRTIGVYARDWRFWFCMIGGAIFGSWLEDYFDLWTLAFMLGWSLFLALVFPVVRSK